MPRILSSDPNAGLDQPVGGRILSSDPNAGLGGRILSSDPNAGLDETQEDEGPSLFGRGLDVLSRVGNTIGRLGAGTAAVANEGVEAYQQGQPMGAMAQDMGRAVLDTFTPTGLGTFARNDDFDKVLGTAGMEEGWTRAGLGLAGDIFIDPLQSGAVRKGIGAAIKATGKAAHVPQAAKAIANTAPVKATTNAIQDVFNPLHRVEGIKSAEEGMDFAKDFRLLESSRRHEGEAATEMAAQMFDDPNASAIKSFFTKVPKAKEAAFAHAMDQGKAVPAGMEDIAKKWKTEFDKQWQTKIDMGSIDPNKKIVNYVPHLTKTGENVEAVAGSSVRGTSRTDMDRKIFSTLRDAVDKGGATDDPRKILAIAISQNQKAARVNDFFKDVVAKNYAVDTPTAGYRKLDRKRLNVPDQTWAALKGKHVPEEVANHLEKATVLWQKPTELDTIYRSSMKLWKGMATTINPSHHFTNFLGNTANMYVSGMSMPEIIKYTKRGYVASGKKMLPDLTTKAGKVYKADELTNLAKKYEIMGTSSQLRELTGEGTADWLVNNKIMKTTRHIGTRWAEEPARIGLFMRELENGKTPKEAAIRVKNILFDYAELSDSERGVRDLGLIPFYTWMRKNTPLQMRQVIEQPQQYEKIGDLVNVPWNARQTEVEHSVIPEREQDQGYVPGRLTADDGSMVMSRLNLPQNDLNKIKDPSSVLLDGLGPVPKAVMALANQYQTGRGITTSTGWANPSGIANAVSGLLPDAIEQQIPDALQGYLNTVTINDKPAQRDIAAWIMKMIPTGQYGSSFQQTDPTQPQINEPWNAMGQRALGLTPNVISPEDQERELERRMSEFGRKQMQKILLEQ